MQFVRASQKLTGAESKESSDGSARLPAPRHNSPGVARMVHMTNLTPLTPVPAGGRYPRTQDASASRVGSVPGVLQGRALSDLRSSAPPRLFPTHAAAGFHYRDAETQRSSPRSTGTQEGRFTTTAQRTRREAMNRSGRCGRCVVVVQTALPSIHSLSKPLPAGRRYPRIQDASASRVASVPGVLQGRALSDLRFSAPPRPFPTHAAAGFHRREAAPDPRGRRKDGLQRRRNGHDVRR